MPAFLLALLWAPWNSSKDLLCRKFPEVQQELPSHGIYIYIYIYILWCARAPTKMHHKATPTLLLLFRYPHLLKSRSGFGGLLKDLRVFLLFSPYGSSSSVSRRESGQTSLLSKKKKMLFPFVLALERIWLSLMGVTFVDNNPWGFQLALCLFPRLLNAIYF